MNIYEDNSFSIGRTPLVRLNRVVDAGDNQVFAKIEGRNPAYSVKCRIGASMIWDAEKRGVLKPGMTIVEPTSGNTGIALAFVGAARGYKVVLTMPETMSFERRKILRALGAEVVLTDGPSGMLGSIKKAEEILSESPDTTFMPQQFKNPANPDIHVQTTGPEIWDDTDGQIDVFVAGVGTGGTISGVSRYIKEHKKKTDLLTVAVEPANSAVITHTLNGVAPTPGPHMIQGIGAGFVPDNLDLSLVDRVELISDEEAMDFSRRLAREEGLLSGISCGAAVAGVHKLLQSGEFSGKTFVVVLPDSGERYLSTMLYDDVM
jgi:cysteine synthase A